LLAWQRLLACHQRRGDTLDVHGDRAGLCCPPDEWLNKCDALLYLSISLSTLTTTVATHTSAMTRLAFRDSRAVLRESRSNLWSELLALKRAERWEGGWVKGFFRGCTSFVWLCLGGSRSVPVPCHSGCVSIPGGTSHTEEMQPLGTRSERRRQVGGLSRRLTRFSAHALLTGRHTGARRLLRLATTAKQHTSPQQRANSVTARARARVRQSLFVLSATLEPMTPQHSRSSTGVSNIPNTLAIPHMISSILLLIGSCTR
jgi:hypothetical protein